MDLCHIIYNSASTASFGEADLVELLERSRNRNAVNGITGMLLHNDGCFFQVLEGPRADVEALVERISRDPRHEQMTVIIDEPIHRRSFAEWTMGFAHISSSELGEIDGLNDFFDGQRVLTEVDAGRAKKLLSAFGQGRWRVRIANKRPEIPPVPGVDRLPQRPSFSVAFQPIVDVAEHAVFAYEAQLRGSADEPGAEVLQRLAISEIDDFDADVRRTAVGVAARCGLQSSLYLGFVPRGIGSAGGHLGTTIATAELTGLDASRLIVEMKHEVSVIDPVAIADALADARRQGVRISIGDFGNGHAGYALLEHYRPEMISLSSWLTHDIAANGPRQAIVRGLMQTCNDLAIDVIARGVDSIEQFDWLRSEGLHLFQGALFAGAAREQLPSPSMPIR